MLILTRTREEEIYITTPGGETIRIKVCRLWRGQVAIGIDAPPEVKVIRGELRRKREERGDDGR